MQKQDVIPIHYFESPDRFADLINGYVYHGEERIRPEDTLRKLHEKFTIMEPAEVYLEKYW